MPDGRDGDRRRRARARLDQAALPGDARKRRRERQRRDARRTRLGIGAFVVLGLLALRAARRARGDGRVRRQPPQALAARPGRAGRELERLRPRLHAQAVPGSRPLGVIARTENRVTRALEGDRADACAARRSRSRTAATGSTARSTGTASRAPRSTTSRPAASARAARRSRSSSRRTSTCSARPSSRSLSRKLDEAWIAVQLQDKYTKAEILTAYLNTVFYGESAYGVEAAAHTFFDRTAKQLTLAAVGAARRPAAGTDRLQPVRPPGRRARSAAPRCCDAMRELRWISADAYAAAINAPLEPEARQLRHAVVLAVRVRPGAPGAQRTSAGEAGRPRRPARVLDGRPAPAVRRAACDQGRAQDAGRVRPPPLSRSTSATATCSRSAPRTTARPRTSSTSPRRATARRARPSSSSRSSTRCERGADP